MIISTSGQPGKSLQLLLRHRRTISNCIADLICIGQFRFRNVIMIHFMAGIVWFLVSFLASFLAGFLASLSILAIRIIVMTPF